MTEAVFSRTMKDGDGNDVTLELMPRVAFEGLGAQVGVRLRTDLKDDMGSIVQTIGLSDDDRLAFAAALRFYSA